MRRDRFGPADTPVRPTDQPGGGSECLRWVSRAEFESRQKQVASAADYKRYREETDNWNPYGPGR